jgi:hypothetical protein
MENTLKENNVTNPLHQLDNFLFPKLDPFFYKYQNRFFFLSLILLILFGIFLFDVKISDGTDVSMFLQEAKNFMEDNVYSTFQYIIQNI